MDVEPVHRLKSDRLGLTRPGEPVNNPHEPRSYVDGLKASLEGISRPLRAKLREWLNKFKRRTERRHETTEQTAARLAKDARLQAAMRSLDKARNRGDRAEVSRIARILREEMGPDAFARRFNFRIRGDEIEFL